MTLMVIGALLFTGRSPAKEGQRRLQAVRYRHSESTNAKVESQLKKAIAARKPKQFKVAGSGSRVEALQMRLERTGKPWTMTQYMYVSAGLAVAFVALGALGACHRSAAPAGEAAAPERGDQAVARVDGSSLTELVITDSIASTEAVARAKRIRTLTIAPLLAEAIKRIADESSVSSLFD